MQERSMSEEARRKGDASLITRRIASPNDDNPINMNPS